jgi:hypothetical protein
MLAGIIITPAQPFQQDKKWGMKDKELIIVKPVFDTIFGFDSTGKVCLACFKTKTQTNNKFIKVTSSGFSCNYFNNKGDRLFVKNKRGDTCSVFALSKSSIRQYQNNSKYFVATVRSKKYLLTKDFVQLTFTGYHDISMCDEPYFYVTQSADEFDVVYTGLVNKKEEQIVPYQYSDVKVNPEDSLIIACSAGLGNNRDDDVYDYNGKKVGGSNKHIEMATKNFFVHKLFDPKEHHIIYNRKTGIEKELVADDVQFYHDDEILIRLKNEWYIYDLNTNQKKPKSKS